MKKKMSVLLKDTAIFAVGNIGSKFILFFMMPLYSAYLSTAEFGVAELVFTFGQFIVPFITLDLVQAITRFGLVKDESTENVAFIGFWAWIISSIIALALVPLYGLYKPIQQWRWYLAAYLIAFNAVSLELGYLKVKDKNNLYALTSLLQTFLMATLNILLLAVIRMGIQGYLIANITASVCASLVPFFVGNFWKDIQAGVFDSTLLYKMIAYSAPLVLNTVSWWLIHSSDKIMIEAMISASALGLYTVAAKMPSLMNVIISIFQQSWGISSIKEAESSNDSEFYTTVFYGYSFITCGACIFLVSIIKPFMHIYVSNESYFVAWRFVPLLLASSVFSSISSFFGGLYGAFKKPINNMATTLIGAAINVVVNYICITSIGVWGAVIGTVCAYFALAHIRMIDIHRIAGIQISVKKYLSNIIIVLVQAILVSLDQFAALISVVAICLFMLNNRNIISFGITIAKEMILNVRK